MLTANKPYYYPVINQENLTPFFYIQYKVHLLYPFFLIPNKCHINGYVVTHYESVNCVIGNLCIKSFIKWNNTKIFKIELCHLTKTSYKYVHHCIIQLWWPFARFRIHNNRRKNILLKGYVLSNKTNVI